MRNSGSCCWNRRGCFLSKSQCSLRYNWRSLCQIFFCSLGSFKNGSTTKARPTRQRIARRSCPHAHPEKKPEQSVEATMMPQEPIRQGAEEQIFGVSVHQVAEEKSKCRRSHASPHLAALSRWLNARPCPMTGSSSDASNVFTRLRSCRMTRSGLYPMRRNAHSDMGPERVDEIMIVRFARNHPLFCRFVAATALFMLDAVGSLFHH